MKLKTCLLIALLAPVSLTHADKTAPTETKTPAETPVGKDSDQVCEKRINAFKSSLQAVIDDKSPDAEQNIDEAKAQLAQINRLPRTLTPCERQREIPAIQNNGAIKDEER